MIGKAIGDFPWVYELDTGKVTEISSTNAQRHFSNMHANRNYRKDGTVIYCEWYNSAIRDQEGNLLSILTGLDVTGRTLARNPLLETNTRAVALQMRN